MRKQAVFTILVVALVVVALSTTAYAQLTYSVYIMDPTNPANGGLGVMSSGHWVGQIPIRITSGSSTYQTVSYCMNYDKTINIGGTYSATLASASDTSAWRAVSYILTWHSPPDSNSGAVNQVAIWRLLSSSYSKPSWLDASIDSKAAALASAANGKDVARSDDLFSWVSPITGNMSAIQANAGETMTFISQLTSSTGTPRANVKILFTATLNVGSTNVQLNSTYVDASETYTDSDGIAQASVQVPSDTLNGATIEVSASTQSVWPQRYVDISGSGNQDLIGIGTPLNLTVSTNMCILGHILVLPESALGAVSAIIAFAAAFLIYAKILKPKTPKTPYF